MELLRWIGFAAFFVSSLIVGLRLIALSHRSGERPELLIGIGVLGLGPCGYGLAVVARLVAEHSASWGSALSASGLIAMTVGASSQFAFVSSVLRTGRAWPRRLALLAVALLVAALISDIRQNGLVDRSNDGFAYWLGFQLRVLSLAWCSIESLRYFNKLRQRNWLGLGDPVVTNRVLLWGLGAGAAFAGSVFGVTAIRYFGPASMWVPMIGLSVSLFGLLAAAAMWLAFLAPESYAKAIAERARRARI